MKNKAFITGVTGFIGSNLAKTLIASGWDVAAVIKKNDPDLDLIKDIKDRIKFFSYDREVSLLIDFINEFKPDVVFHLASCFLAEHQPQQINNLIDSNILFGTHLLEAMFKANVKNLINTGTSWQHYQNEDYNPVCLYAATKESFEKIIDYYVQAHHFKVVTLELFDTYGPNDPRKKLITLFKKIAASGEQLLMSPGEQELDLVYIDDVIAAYKQAFALLQNKEMPGHEKHVVTTGRPMKLKEIAQLFESIFACKLNIVWGGRPYRTREVMNIWDKGSLLPRWQPKYTLTSGLKKLTRKDL